MPIYVYRCPKCGTDSKVTQKFNDPPPHCTRENSDKEVCGVLLEKQVARTSFQLSGSGWYSDGY